MPACIGYLVMGAGLSGANGCYTPSSTSPQLFVLDSSHQLYTWAGTWRIGDKGHAVDYIATQPSSWPPEDDGGCSAEWMTGTGRLQAAANCPDARRFLRAVGHMFIIKLGISADASPAA